jgi:hypothetical protein
MSALENKLKNKGSVYTTANGGDIKQMSLRSAAIVKTVEEATDSKGPLPPQEIQNNLVKTKS